ncbi:hypothetical protein ACQP2K_19125 [Microbispora siamensis]
MSATAVSRAMSGRRGAVGGAGGVADDRPLDVLLVVLVEPVLVPLVLGGAVMIIGLSPPTSPCVVVVVVVGGGSVRGVVVVVIGGGRNGEVVGGVTVGVVG